MHAPPMAHSARLSFQVSIILASPRLSLRAVHEISSAIMAPCKCMQAIRCNLLDAG
jgi:hypothetical protein